MAASGISAMRAAASENVSKRKKAFRVRHIFYDFPDYILRWFRAVQAFSLLSWVYFLTALVLIMVFVFCIPGKKVMYIAALIFSFAGGFCALISFTVYAGKFTVGLNQYSVAFALTILASILGFIIGFIGVFDYLNVGRGERVIKDTNVYYDFDFY
ncbi:hypothetical protein CHS0354_039765 [Potamilus streckersoni]|uniref:Uncharacterized protein n=1 Tax=Potamilus streckersoni TaxID=2493646 RepID=A0AAE0S098_9BIVA|nr:hypothetical protein CHS0354_039765 [Potamilus streckersoni]